MLIKSRNWDDLYRKENEPFINEYEIFSRNNELRMIYLTTISPELFGMDESTGYFIEYKQFEDIINKNSLQKFKISESLGEKIEKSRCELNYDYITFISNEPSMLIIKNNTETMYNELHSETMYTGLYENYFWSQIYAQARLWKRIHIESEFNYDVQNKIDIYHLSKLNQDHVNDLNKPPAPPKAKGLMFLLQNPTRLWKKC